MLMNRGEYSVWCFCFHFVRFVASVPMAQCAAATIATKATNCQTVSICVFFTICNVLSMGVLKRKRLWIYLSDQDQETVTKLAEMCAPLKESDLCSALVAAAISACDKSGGISLPVKFEVATSQTAALRREVAVTKGKEGEVKLPASRK